MVIKEWENTECRGDPETLDLPQNSYERIFHGGSPLKMLGARTGVQTFLL